MTTLALQLLTGELAGAADGLGLFARSFLRRLFVEVAQFHFTENAFTLHFLLQGAQRLIHIVVANDNLHLSSILASNIRAGFPATIHK